MEIDRLRYFLVFSELGSLVKAAGVLGVSQPALSKSLKLLESEMGTALVEQEGRGLRLTPAGLLLKKEATPLLSQWRGLPEKIRGAKEAAPVRIGSFEVFTTYFLRRLLDFADLAHLEIHELTPGPLEEAIHGGEVDLGITYAPVPRSGVTFTEVTRIEMGVFGLPKAHRGLEFDSLPFAIPLTPSTGTPSKVVGLDGWPDHRHPRKVDFRVTLMQSALELCRRGRAVAFLPRFVVELHNEAVKNELRLVELEAPLPRKERLQSVFLVKRQGAEESRLERQIAKALRSLD